MIVGYGVIVVLTSLGLMVCSAGHSMAVRQLFS